VLILLAICGSLIPSCGVEALGAPFTYAKLAFGDLRHIKDFGPSERTRYWGVIREGDNYSRGTARLPGQALEIFVRCTRTPRNPGLPW
jgi:hypothetical protein